VPNTQFASLMQAVVAAPWLGKRVVFSVSYKMRYRWQDLEIWLRALDGSNVVIAYDAVHVHYTTAEWKKATVALDIPWSASEIAYGANLRGVGSVWIDAARLDVVDKSVPVVTGNYPAQLGVVAQDASVNGPLGMPSNMDFEDVVVADETFRLVPK